MEEEERKKEIFTEEIYRRERDRKWSTQIREHKMTVAKVKSVGFGHTVEIPKKLLSKAP